MEIVVTGDSHIAMLQKGFQEYSTQFGPLNDTEFHFVPMMYSSALREPFFTEKRGHAQIKYPVGHPRPNEPWDRFVPRAFDEPGTVYVFSGPFSTRHFYRKMHWSLNRMAASRLGLDWLLRPFIKRAVRRDLQFIEAFVALVRRSAAQIIVVESCYPYRSDRHVNKYGGRNVLEVDAVYREEVARMLASLDVEAVRVPWECRDEDGFMRPEYRIKERPDDTTHANTKFGVVVIDQLVKHLNLVPKIATVESARTHS